MDYKEIIERELERLCAVKGEQNNTIDLNAYGVGVLDGLTSPLAKQITEIEKLEFADFAIKDLLKMYHMQQSRLFEQGFKMKTIDEMAIAYLKRIESERDKLINELKLK